MIVCRLGFKVKQVRFPSQIPPSLDLSSRNDLADCWEVAALVNSRRRARQGRCRGAGPDPNERASSLS